VKKLLLLFLLSGCTAVQTLDPVVQKTAPVSIPTVQPLTLHQVQWKVLNASDLKALLDGLKDNKDIVLFALDASNYQNLNLNYVEIKRYISEEKTVILLLKNIADQQSGVVSSTQPTTSTQSSPNNE
jgi:uncharacterized protein YceK